QRPHPHFSGTGLGRRLVAQLGPAGAHVSERFALHRLAQFYRPALVCCHGRHPLYPQIARKDTHGRCMLERSIATEIEIETPPVVLAWRRAFYCVLAALSIAGLVWLAVVALSPSGFGAVDLLLVILFTITLPWYVIGFWN